MAYRFQNALDIQYACNITGIAHAIIQAGTEIREVGGGSPQINACPAIALMIHQLSHLSTHQGEWLGMEEWIAAEKACRDAVKQPEPA